jgi:Uma2 family endonuclease
MAVKERISERAYLAHLQQEPDGVWELWDGAMREKPPMSWEHGDINALLSHMLQQQLNRNDYRVRINEGRVRRSAEHYFVPDLVVIPTALGAPYRDQPGVLPIFRDPLPLVIEVWSRSTGDYDVDAKIPQYKARGDREIWRIHPYDRILTAWVRQDDGSYVETIHRGGVVRPTTLPNVEIDLALLFAG